MTSTYDEDIIREFGTAAPGHVSLPLYESAACCGHPERAEGSDARDAWRDDHPNCTGFSGEPVCLLTPAGSFCAACTVVARDAEDLPVDEYVACRRSPESEPDTTKGE